MEWASGPEFGAAVTFCGTVRNHSDGRPDVISLDYEAFDEEVERRLGGLAAGARVRWPTIGRVALLHRLGTLAVGEVSVVVVSSPRRDEAFEAARFCIDTLKPSVPIWKKETWAGGSDWSACAHTIEPVDLVGVEDHCGRRALTEKRSG